MEAVNSGIRIDNYSGRVNHGLWDSIATIATLGISDLVKGEAKNSRVAIEKREYEFLVRGLIAFYENPTIPKVTLKSVDGSSVELTRTKFLSDSNIPAVMIDKTVTPWKPTYAAYVWASVQDSVIFRGVPAATAEARHGNIVKFQPVEFGKMDWNTILKQAGVMVAAMVGTIATGGIAAPAAVAAVKNVYTIQKQADELKKITPLITPAIASAKEQQEKIDAANAAALSTKTAGFLSFDNPYFIMVAMTVATIILYFVFKKTQSK